MYPDGRPTRRESLQTSLDNEQAIGARLIGKRYGALRAKRSTRLDRTWAVRDADQTLRQKKRDQEREILRPVLTMTEISKTRTEHEWDWV